MANTIGEKMGKSEGLKSVLDSFNDKDMDKNELQDDLFLMLEAARKVYNVQDSARMKVSWARIYKILEDAK